MNVKQYFINAYDKHIASMDELKAVSAVSQFATGIAILIVASLVFIISKIPYINSLCTIWFFVDMIIIFIGKYLKQTQK